MYHVMICDDDDDCVRLMEEKLSISMAELKEEYQCWTSSNPFQAMEQLQKEPYELLLLDIDMPKASGFDVAQVLKAVSNPPLLIFVSSISTLVYDSIRFKPFRFLRKERLDLELTPTLRDALHELRQQVDVFRFWTEYQFQAEIFLRDILYMEVLHNVVNIVTKERVYHCRNTLNSIEDELSPKGFFRIHRSYLVNIEYIASVSAKTVKLYLPDGIKEFPLSRKAKDTVKKAFIASLR